MHVVLPETALARGKVGNTASYKSSFARRKSFPLMTWEQLAYVQIDCGGFVHRGGRLRDLRRRRVAGGIQRRSTSPPSRRSTSSITKCVTPEGVSYTAHKCRARETEFIRSKDMWLRPIETRVGPDGALYVVDFYNQAVIHNDTRGPDHNSVNAAVRPDRDHYFGRIWRVDHKQAKKIAVPDLAKASAGRTGEGAGTSESRSADERAALARRKKATLMLRRDAQLNPLAGAGRDSRRRRRSAIRPSGLLEPIWSLTDR